jgi:hypothetical protein
MDFTSIHDLGHFIQYPTHLLLHRILEDNTSYKISKAGGVEQFFQTLH